MAESFRDDKLFSAALLRSEHVFPATRMENSGSKNEVQDQM